MQKVRSVVAAQILPIAGAIAVLGGSQGARAQQDGRGHAFVNANVLTMRNASVLQQYTVLVFGDTIAAVGPTDAIEIPEGVAVIDATGQYLLPGLADMHIHLHAESELVSFVRFGVTTVLQMSSDSRTPRDILEYRRRLADGSMLGPTLYSTGPMFADGRFTQDGRQPVTPADVPAILEAHRAEGHDFVKVHNMVPAAVYRALVSANTLPVVGHMPVAVGPQESLRSGQRMVAHAELFYYGYFFDYSCLSAAPFWDCAARTQPDYDRIDEIARLVDSAGVVVTANLSYVAADLRLTRNVDSVLSDAEFNLLAPAVRSAWQDDLPARRSFPENRRRDVETRYPFTQQLVKALSDLGVPLITGTDTPLPGVYPGKSLHLELAELVRAGLTPFAALQAGTITAGQFIRTNVPGAEAFGIVQRGYRADLLLVAENPLEHIDNIASITGTMVRGKYWPVAALDSLRNR